MRMDSALGVWVIPGPLDMFPKVRFSGGFLKVGEAELLEMCEFAVRGTRDVRSGTSGVCRANSDCILPVLHLLHCTSLASLLVMSGIGFAQESHSGTSKRSIGVVPPGKTQTESSLPCSAVS